MITMNKAYNDKTEARIHQEFPRLKDICYLDHAGATLYSEIQIKNIYEDLASNLYGNPHSLNSSSKQSSDLIDQIRRRVLKHFHTTSDEYCLIFTSGATAAIKLLLENFDWGIHLNKKSPPIHSGAYIYTQSSHTSVVGAREIARLNRTPFFCLGYEETRFLLEDQQNICRKNVDRGQTNSLFAYPAQCNFSGRKYPLDWIEKVHEGALDSYGLNCSSHEGRNSKWFCLLDAATYCSTNDLNLTEIKPDFVCVSFYKIFGYPSGLGALLVRNSSAYVLRKKYFGGGTVDIVLPFQEFHKKRNVLHERFEDGTIPFLSIISLEHGLNTLNRLNIDMTLISHHVFNLAKYAVEKFKVLRHWNGTEVVELYADSYYDNIAQQGGIINFNLKRANGQYIGFAEVLHVANLRKIYLRTGCFCNLGACQRHLKLNDADLKHYYHAGHVCGDAKDLIEGKPTGSIRVSFGYMTTQSDADKLVHMIKDCFIEITPQTIPSQTRILDKEPLKLSKILLFPVKSCGAMEVKSWRLNNRGLEYDREWMIVTSTGLCLSQKRESRLCMIRPNLNLKTRTLTLEFESSNDTLEIPLDVEGNSTKYDLCESKVCNNLIQVYDCGDDASEWLGRHLSESGLRLVRQTKEDIRYQWKKNLENFETENQEMVKLSLSNQAQYLLLSNESIRWLTEIIGPDEEIDFENFSDRFRGNFYINGGRELDENSWTHLSIGNAHFRVEGPCGRCQIICIDQKTGMKNRKPLVALSRALNGKLQFGIYLSQIVVTNDAENVSVTVGDTVIVHKRSE